MQEYLPPMSERGARWTRFLALLAALAVLVWLAIRLRDALTPIVAALAIAYILNPAVGWLERRFGVGRVTSVSMGLVLVIVLVLAAATGAVIQIAALAEDVPGYVRDFVSWLSARFPNLLQGVDAQRLTTLAQTHGLTAGKFLLDFLTGLAAGLWYWLTLIVLVPLFAFFFLLRFDQMLQTLHDHLPAASRPTVVRVLTTIDRAVSSFFRGRLIVCFLIGFLLGLGWLMVGVQHSLLLGALAGVLNLVPYLSLLALPPALIFAYLGVPPEQSWVGPVTLTMVVFLAVQAIESFLLTPLIEARASGLHPITTVIALMIGGQLAGLLGLLLAIPVASTLKSLGAEYVLPEIRRLARHPGATPPAGGQPAAEPAPQATQRPAAPSAAGQAELVQSTAENGT